MQAYWRFLCRLSILAVLVQAVCTTGVGVLCIRIHNPHLPFPKPQPSHSTSLENQSPSPTPSRGSNPTGGPRTRPLLRPDPHSASKKRAHAHIPGRRSDRVDPIGPTRRPGRNHPYIGLGQKSAIMTTCDEKGDEITCGGRKEARLEGHGAEYGRLGRMKRRWWDFVP